MITGEYKRRKYKSRMTVEYYEEKVLTTEDLHNFRTGN